MQQELTIQQQLDLYEQNIGQQFTLVGHKESNFCTGTTLTDTISGVDRKFEMICGTKYGDFHVSLVRLKKQNNSSTQKNLPL